MSTAKEQKPVYKNCLIYESGIIYSAIVNVNDVKGFEVVKELSGEINDKEVLKFIEDKKGKK